MHGELIPGFCSWYRSEKTSILSELIRKTNVQEMKWIIMIILKGGTLITLFELFCSAALTFFHFL